MMQRSKSLAACLVAAVAVATSGCALLARPADPAKSESAGTDVSAAETGSEPGSASTSPGVSAANDADATHISDAGSDKDRDATSTDSTASATAAIVPPSEGDAASEKPERGSEDPSKAKDAEQSAGGEPSTNDETGPKLELSVAWVSDYVFRGVSLSNRLPALQGSLDYSFPLAWGLSGNVGLWRSLVRFDTDAEFAPDQAPDPAPTVGVRRESGIYGGVYGDLIAGWTWSVQLYSYRYAGFRNLDYVEKSITVTRPFADIPGQPQIEISRATFRSVFFPGSDGKYLEVNLKLALIHEFTLAAHLGKSRFADQSLGGRDYVDRSITLSRPFGKFLFDLSATSTNTDQFGKIGGPALYLRVSRTF